MFTADMQPIDYVSYILVGALTIGGIIAIVVSLIRGTKKRQMEQDRHDSTGVFIPRELAKLDDDKYIVRKWPKYMTLLGRSIGSHIIFSVYGIFILEYAIESGRIGGRFGNSHWYKSTAMGMGSRGFTSPMWRALVHEHSLIAGVPEVDALPIFPMAVLPDGTSIDIHLNPYRLDEPDDDDEWDDDEYENEEDTELSDDPLNIVDESEESEEYEDDEEEPEEDLEVAFDPTKFVGCIEDICEFIADNSTEEVMTFDEVKKLAAKCEEYFAEVEEMENPVVPKNQIPVEYLSFSRDYHNKKHLKQLEEEGKIVVVNKKDKKAAEAAAAAEEE